MSLSILKKLNNGWRLCLIFIFWNCTDMGTESTNSTPELYVSYSADIQPIFNANCIQCHGVSGELSLTSYDGLIEGGLHGTTIIPGNGEESLIINKLGSEPPFGEQMPLGLSPLDPSLIELIKTWIDAGAENN